MPPPTPSLLLGGSPHILVPYKDINDGGALLHECYHAVCPALTSHGVLPGPETEEVYAYHLEYAFIEVTKLIKELVEPKGGRKKKVAGKD